MTVSPWLRGRLGILLSLGPACAVETLPGVPGLLLAPVGLWLLLVAPVLLLRGLTDKVVSTRSGSVLLAVGLTVVLDILVALAVNTALPVVGVERPLTRLVLAAATTAVLLVLGVFAPEPETPLLRSGPGAVPARWRGRPGRRCCSPWPARSGSTTGWAGRSPPPPWSSSPGWSSSCCCAAAGMRCPSWRRGSTRRPPPCSC
ncbi:hypothetical protein WKI68_03790 [Streptomyces sp. MS1.HAVA.3]|uniref:DUF1616 domain-containing protein n=1 Tax=Streptomyces caledonius TaxID=3134107 RepID=A0ABU8TYW5_9ACTN